MNAEKALSRRVLEIDPAGSREVAARVLRLRQAGADVLSLKGGPFLFLNISQLERSSGEFSRRLLEGFGVPTVPGHCFQSSDHLRLPFGAHEVVIEEAVRRLERAALT